MHLDGPSRPCHVTVRPGVALALVAIVWAGCGRPASWTYPTGHPGTWPSSSPAGGQGWRLRLPGTADVDAANQQAAQRAQHVTADDPLSLRYMPRQVGPEVHVYAAKLFERQGKWEKAVERYQEALQVDAHHEPALLGLAHLYDRLGKFDEAHAWYERAVRNHPQSAPARNDWAMCLARQGRMPEAIALWHEAIQLAPSDVLYRNNLARALVQTGQLDQAYAQLIAVLPPAAAHYNIGYMLYEFGRLDLAAVALGKSLQIDPSFRRSQKLLATITQSGSPGVPQPPGHPERLAGTRNEALPPTTPVDSSPPVPALPSTYPTRAASPDVPPLPSRYTTPTRY